jgi:DNA-binding beta-propeller fold protein YncE
MESRLASPHTASSPTRIVITPTYRVAPSVRCSWPVIGPGCDRAITPDARPLYVANRIAGTISEIRFAKPSVATWHSTAVEPPQVARTGF